MFTIDLLKGQGIPVKTSPQGIAIIATGVAVPFVAALVFIGIYLHNRVVIPIMQNELAVYEQKMQTLSEGVKLQQMFNKEKDSINGCIPEVASAVRKFTTWSPVIRTIAENMPAVMILNQLNVKQTVDSQAGGVVREVNMNISGNAAGNWDEEVKSFRNRLLESSVLKSKLQDVSVAQQSSRGGEKDVTSYELRMIFKGAM